MSMKIRLTAFTMAIFILVSIFVGCTKTETLTSASASTATTSPEGTPAKTLDKENPVYLGFLFGITGDSSSTEIPSREGVIWAVENINANGGVLGRELKVIIEDNQSTADGTVTAMSKLAADERISCIMGPARSVLTSALLTQMEEVKIPWICYSTSAVLLKKSQEKVNPYLFFERTNDSIVANAGAKWIKEQGFKRIGIFYNNDDSGTSGRDIFSAYFDKNGIEYTAQGHNQNDQDFTAQILAFKNFDCDLLLCWTHSVGAATFLRQRMELGFPVPVAGSTAMGEQSTTGLVDASALENCYVITDFALDSPEECAQEIIQPALKKFTFLPPTLFFFAYASVQICCDAIETVGDPNDRVAIRDAIAKIKDLPTAYGTLSVNGQMVANKAYIIKFNKDKSESTLAIVEG